MLCMAILVTIIVVIHLTVYITTKKGIEAQFVNSAKGIAVSIADSMMMNIIEYKLFLATRDVDSEYYKNMQAYLAHIRLNGNLKYIYTERRLDAETIEFILDAEPIESPDHSPPGSTGPNDRYREMAYSTGKPSGFEIVEYERWGKLLGAYAPIFDSYGEMLGLVGVNIDASHLYAQLNNLNLVLFMTYGVIIGLSVLSLSKYSNVILEPMLKDKLTGAFSKRYFEKFLREEIKRSIRNCEELALMVLDLDHFKKVNDTYGHVFGDKVLSSTSEVIKRTLRPSDYLIRYGGEEFIVVIAKVDNKHVLEVAERIRRAVENNEVFNEERDIPIKVTISIGVSSLNNLSMGPKELVNNADKALYAAKVTRNTVSMFDSVSMVC